MKTLSKCSPAIFVIEIHARTLNCADRCWCAYPECASMTVRAYAEQTLEACRARFPENQFRIATYRRVTRDGAQQFAASGQFVYHSEAVAARAASATMAKRIANALNVYQADKRGQ